MNQILLSFSSTARMF